MDRHKDQAAGPCSASLPCPRQASFLPTKMPAMGRVPVCLLKEMQQVSQQGKYEQMGNLASSEFQEKCKASCASSDANYTLFNILGRACEQEMLWQHAGC